MKRRGRTTFVQREGERERERERKRESEREERGRAKRRKRRELLWKHERSYRGEVPGSAMSVYYQTNGT